VNEAEYVEAVDKAIVKAGWLLDLADAKSEEEHAELADQRLHCGTCTVRTVMEQVMPPLRRYLEAAKRGDL
jgi:hypothetical protein